MSYIDVTGKTEEEAIAKALEQLGMDRCDVSVEILERAKSGFLGFGSNPARVRVSYGPEDAGFDEVEPVAPIKPAKAEPAKAEKKPQPKAQPKREEKPQAEKQPEKKPQPEVEVAPIDLPISEDNNAKRITAFLSGLLEHLEAPAQIKVYEVEKSRYKVILEGDKLGALIGRRGETLDAIQQLTNYAVNEHGEKRIRIQIDAENYRAKREASLESLAHKVAAKVIKYRRSVTLESMNAYERHVIHAALQDEPNITT